MSKTNINILTDKAIAFAVKILELDKSFTDKTAEFLSKELVRCACGIGASLSHTSTDASAFVASIKNVLESEYWLQLLIAGKYVPEGELSRALVYDCRDLKKLLYAALEKDENGD